MDVQTRIRRRTHRPAGRSRPARPYLRTSAKLPGSSCIMRASSLTSIGPPSKFHELRGNLRRGRRSKTGRHAARQRGTRWMTSRAIGGRLAQRHSPRTGDRARGRAAVAAAGLVPADHRVPRAAVARPRLPAAVPSRRHRRRRRGGRGGGAEARRHLAVLRRGELAGLRRPGRQAVLPLLGLGPVTCGRTQLNQICMVIRLLDLCSTPTHWADIGLARPVAARGLRVQPVIHSAIGRWHVTMTDRNEQSVIS